jgi:hypothetical protein
VTVASWAPAPRGPKPQLDAALWNAGERGSIVLGTARNAPPRPIAALKSLMFAGGELVGSDLDLDCAAPAARVGEVRHAVRAHAVGELDPV